MPQPLTPRQLRIFAVGYFLVVAVKLVRSLTQPFPEPYDSLLAGGEFIAGVGLIVVLYRSFKQVWTPNAK